MLVSMGRGVFPEGSTRGGSGVIPSAGRFVPESGMEARRSNGADMRLTKYGHACVRLEKDSGVLVIDPGAFSDPRVLDGADAVLITHEHLDHVAVDVIEAAVRARPQMRVWTHTAVAGLLGALESQVTTVDTGEEFTAAGFRVRAVGGEHAVIHPDIPVCRNLGFLIEEGAVYHPGDSLALPGTEVEVLLLPVAAPWLKLAGAADFARTVAPKRALPIHDAILSAAGLSVVDRLLGGLLREHTEYARIDTDEGVEIA